MIRLRKKLSSLLGPVVRAKIRRRLDRFQISTNFAKDRRRFLKWSSAVHDPVDRQQLASHLTMDYHRIEKGMALPAPRVGFGSDVIMRLIADLKRYTGQFGADDTVDTVLAVLKQYQSSQLKLGFENSELDEFLAGSDGVRLRASSKTGTIPLERDSLYSFDSAQAEQFLLSRHSMRQYTGEIVPDTVIEKIAALAQRAPSVCNRQSCRLYVANSRNKIADVLALQNGNRGFGHTLGGVFIVTSDLRSFVNLGERNQAYVDGGIFAQQVLLAIHSQNLGGCMLNWSATVERDLQLRKLVPIPEHDVVITMIGFGYTPEKMVAAASPRIERDQVLRYL